MMVQETGGTQKLELVATISVAANKAAVRLCHLGDNFKRHFGRMVGDAWDAAEIRVHKLSGSFQDATIIAELADKGEILLGQFLALLLKQEDGEPGPLLTVIGRANIAYIRDDRGTLWVVAARWSDYGGGWMVEAYSTSNWWPGGDHVLSR